MTYIMYIYIKDRTSFMYNTHAHILCDTYVSVRVCLCVPSNNFWSFNQLVSNNKLTKTIHNHRRLLISSHFLYPKEGVLRRL